jgi:hypothetical protein
MKELSNGGRPNLPIYDEVLDTRLNSKEEIDAFLKAMEDIRDESTNMEFKYFKIKLGTNNDNDGEYRY